MKTGSIAKLLLFLVSLVAVASCVSSPKAPEQFPLTPSDGSGNWLISRIGSTTRGSIQAEEITGTVFDTGALILHVDGSDGLRMHCAINRHLDSFFLGLEMWSSVTNVPLYTGTKAAVNIARVGKYYDTTKSFHDLKAMEVQINTPEHTQLRYSGGGGYSHFEMIVDQYFANGMMTKVQIQISKDFDSGDGPNPTIFYEFEKDIVIAPTG